MHDGVWVPAEDRAFTTRLARHCARAPVALERLAYEAATGTVRDQSDKATGPTAATETLDLLEWLARVVSHIPNKGPVLQRYYGWDANRTRGRRRRAGMPEPRPLLEPTPVEAAAPTLQKARRRWAELRRRIFGVDRLRCPRCWAPMRIVGFVTQPGWSPGSSITCAVSRPRAASPGRPPSAAGRPARPRRPKPRGVPALDAPRGLVGCAPAAESWSFPASLVGLRASHHHRDYRRQERALSGAHSRAASAGSRGIHAPVGIVAWT